ncbi:unknown [Lactobacillus phage Lb338-1]|uniref:Phage protein n=1 Tax=Lactobacillus phage Lb338-1 TaxID=2892342 RepID=C1KFI7_9CAUD|nr:hypothetical protein lb338_phage_77 [Lactobacillus phage Lb338-1]ACO36998.1 unknown [Lactobacillus phage Lb338-1]
MKKKAKQYVAKDISNTIGEHVYLNHLKVVENEEDDIHSTLLLEYPYYDDVIVYLVRAIPNTSCIDFVVSPLVEDDRKVIVYSPEVAENGDVLPTKLDIQQDQKEFTVPAPTGINASDFVKEKVASLKDSNYQRLIRENNELKKKLEKANNCDWEDLRDFLDFPEFRKAEKVLKKALNNWLDSEGKDK